MPVDFSKLGLDIEPAELNIGVAKGNRADSTALRQPMVQTAQSVAVESDFDEDFVSANFIIPKIRTVVLSCGNAGGNILKHILTKNPCEDVEYIMTDTDYMALNKKRTDNCKVMLLGEKTCKGFGAGMHPEIAEAAANESEEKLRKVLRGASLVFIIAGEGGGSGTGCSPVVARIAKEEGANVIAMVTKPFRFEGKIVMNRAAKGISDLRDQVDAIEVIDNQKVFCIGDANIPASVRFSKIDEFVSDMVAGFVNVTRDASTIKLDFQDLKKTLEECQGDLFIGVGESTYDAPSNGAPWDYGEQAMMEAIERAISCPLIDGVNMQNAKGVIALYLVGDDIPLEILEKAQDAINLKVDAENANIVFGADFNENMNGKIKVFFIIAGLNASEDEVKEHVASSFIVKPSPFEKGEKINMFDGNATTTEVIKIEELVGASQGVSNITTDFTPNSDTSEPATQTITSTADIQKVNEHRIKGSNSGGSIYGIDREKTSTESADKQPTPSIYGFEKAPDFMRIQCQ
ncbi:MAG: cell division FtsZ family protein [Chitinivibrionia bacterium]|nr:cell division FtsZ family protein [Chitinivibrionia bacterium]